MRDNSITRSEPAVLSDTVNLIHHGIGLLLGVAGTVKLVTIDGYTDTLTLASGVWHPIQVKQIFSTGTDAGLDIHVGW